MSMHWSTQYVGLPHEIGGRSRAGLDCWGLVHLFFREQYGIKLPELPGITADVMLSICREVEQQQQTVWKELAAPVDKCLVGMSQHTRGRLHHVGIWTDADGGRIIHVSQSQVVADTMRKLRMRGFAHIKYYCYGLDY